ncbi:MAG: ankyrin repeat domain-containing protein [Alphaproteobacteria bacterium]|nr:ankyrin repeat domain-containing protein [Alphaproteobacteria bacterium]MDE2336049.1 ankyrin repeat domain-containing protein [Alphaproteobacteria bacterium]
MPQFPNTPSPKPASGELMSAVISNNLMTVRRLLDQKADIDEKDLNGNTPLNRAADLGHTEIVRALIEKGADVNTKNLAGDTPLMSAIAAYPAYNYNNDSINISRLLIAAGANMDVKNKQGETAMGIAEQRNKTTIITMMKEEKAKRKRLAEEYAKAAEKKRQETVADRQQELREQSKSRPKLKPRPPKAA